MSIQVIPAILSKSFREIEEKISLVKGLVDTVQVDICDGGFADNKTWPYFKEPTAHDPLQTTKKDVDFQDLITDKKGLPFWEDIDYEFDLMVRAPESIIGDYVRMGTTRLLIHLESTKQMEDIIAEWKNAVELGIALKPSTPLSELDSFMHEIRYVQCMGSDRISHAGVSLNPRVYERIRELHTRYPDVAISVDIGVNFETAPLLIEIGRAHV